MGPLSTSGDDSSEDKPDDKPEDDKPDDDENFLNNGTVPSHGFAFQAFSGKEYGGEATEIYTSEGFHDFGFTAKSYVWIPNDSGCCVAFCEDEKNTTNRWCPERFREDASEPFPRLGVLCGTNFNNDGKSQWCKQPELR